MPDSIGLYIHIPFCAKKCLYCDFYSAILNEKVYKDYFSALLREIELWGRKINRTVDTVYIGGGTPSLLGEDIIPLMETVRSSFLLSENAEITAECNPNLNTDFLYAAAKSGVNRISFGAQSGDDSRLQALGRTHTINDVRTAVDAARKAGIKNISLDIMICLPDSNIDTIKQDIDFICSINPEHISAYILKIEENTAFYKQKDILNLPDDDSASEQYLTLCSQLKKHGYEHYEISNFAKKGYKSRHNLKYWRCEEYLGIGPSAHSFVSGKRFYYKKDIRAFICGEKPVFESTGGDKSERIMLSLRTNDGVLASIFPDCEKEKISRFKRAGLIEFEDGKITLTDKGMLLSNSIISELIYEDL